MNTKKSNQIFINKYDYMRSYTRCDSVWFLKNAEIEAVITNLLKKNKDEAIFLIDEEDDQVDSDNEIDNYEDYRYSLIDNESLNINDLNVNKQEEIDPKIIEGQIIDKKAKEFIVSQFEHDIVIDYDDVKYQNIKFDNLKASEVTLFDINSLIAKNQKFILFQPTFINKTANNNYFVTKCDAIVYLNKNESYLVEVKGTTTSKRIHLLDFLFQKFVLLNEDLPFQITDYKLCLVSYKRANKNEIPFILDEYCNETKTLSYNPDIWKTFNDNEKQKYKKGKYELKIKDILDGTLSEDNLADIFLQSYKKEDRAVKAAEKKIKEVNEMIDLLSSTFETRIDDLSNQKLIKKNIVKLFPCLNCKSTYKNCEYWLKCRDLFKYEFKNGNKSLKPFTFSGNVINFETQLKISNNIQNNPNESINYESFVKPEKYEKFVNLFQHKDLIDINKTKELFDKLHSKQNRVYFDFESINTAIRPMDNVYPFNQIITQNTVIKTKNYYEEFFNENMIIDPLNIDLNWIKSIIDTLYEDEDYWYIVFNKNFEATRLKEMKELINLTNESIEIKKIYAKKIDTIISNIFDLADFFNPFKNLILLDSLHGFYSIKKILEIIPNEILLKAQTKSYHDLQIYNGAVAQNVTTKRFFKLVDDFEWNEIEKQLQIYCQNDVRAMIAVELFVNYLIENYRK